MECGAGVHRTRPECVGIRNSIGIEIWLTHLKHLQTQQWGQVTQMFTPVPVATETTIIGLNIANILTVSITVNVQLINNDGDNVHIVKSAIVPVGSSLVAVGGDQKIVMNASDILK